MQSRGSALQWALAISAALVMVPSFHRWRTGRGISRGAEADAGREGESLEQLRPLRPA